MFVLRFYWINETHRIVDSNEESKPEEKEESEEAERPEAIISNHVSYLYILYHMSSSFSSFVAKRSVAKLPLVGLISKCPTTEVEIGGSRYLAEEEKEIKNNESFRSREEKKSTKRSTTRLIEGLWLNGLSILRSPVWDYKALLYPGAVANGLITNMTIPSWNNLLEIYNLTNVKEATPVTDLQRLEVCMIQLISSFFSDILKQVFIVGGEKWQKTVGVHAKGH